ncbi:MAG: response regulator [Verrucomicrobia bacterium]|nr:response regulator [Verrucomicrobiota bacterium]
MPTSSAPKEPVAVVVLDNDGTITHWSAAAERLLGHTAASVAGGSCLRLLTPGWERRMRDEFWHFQPFQPVRTRLTVRRPDGQRLPLEIEVEPMRGTDGHRTGWLCLCRPTRKMAQHGPSPSEVNKSDLPPLMEELRRAWVVAALTRGMTHQMNNALTGVLSHLELAHLEGESLEECRRHLTLAQASARQAAETNTRLAGFMRSPVSQPTPVDLAKVAEETVALLRRCLGRRVQVSVEVASRDLWPVQARESQMLEATLLLCLHAHASLPDGGEICIRIENADPASLPAPMRGNSVRLSVSHTPSAVKPTELPTLLAPPEELCHLTPPTLGLQRARQIVARHEGDICAEPCAAQGVRITLTLPCASAYASKPQPLAGEPSKLSAQALNGTETILVADDENLVRGLIRAVLAYRGYRVVEAADGREAVAKYQSHMDLVLLDVDMPFLDGRGALSGIRQTNPTAKVVMLSGEAPNPQLAGDLQSLGASALLMKPFRNTELLRVVRQTLDARAG